MRIALLVAATAGLAGAAEAQVAVRGHFRSDGTYVAPHIRSSPNATTLDNLTPRTSPEPFTRAPLAPPAPQSSSPPCSGMGCYGQPSSATGRPRTATVRGYTRRDGTYVAPYTRSRQP